MWILSAIYVAVFVVWVPSLAFRSRRVLAQGGPLPSKRRILTQTIVMLVLFGALSVFVARTLEIPITGPLAWSPRAALVSVVALVLMLATIPLRWRSAPEATKRRMMLTRPQSVDEMGLWTVVSAAAGVFEEITYRGVLFSILWYATGSAVAAAAVSAIAFAIAHALQGWRAGFVILSFALVAHWVVWLAGSLYYAMLLHFIYDFLAGCIYLRLGRDVPAPAAS